MKNWIIATIGLASFAGSAMAADLPARTYTKAPPPPPPPVVTTSWTGCYLGAGGGYGMWNQENTAFSPTTGALVAGSATTGGRGWFGTVQGGCDYQVMSNWVIGAFADYDFTDVSGDLAIGGAAIGNEKMSHKWSAGGRLGYLPAQGQGLMVFVSGGWTEARFDGVSFASLLGGPVIAAMPARNYSGWFIGGGYEYALGWFPGLYWKGEYRYSEYDTERNTVFNVPGGTAALALDSRKFSQEIRSELVWRFNAGGLINARY